MRNILYDGLKHTNFFYSQNYEYENMPLALQQGAQIPVKWSSL